MSELGLDLAIIKGDAEVQEAQQQVAEVVRVAAAVEIHTEVDYAQAMDLLAECRRRAKAIDGLRIKFVGPLNDHIKVVNKFFKDAAQPLKEADAILASKGTDYRAEVQAKVDKENARQRKLAEQRQQRAADKAEATGTVPPVAMPVVPTVAPPAKTVATASGGKVTMVERWSFQITDASAVPRDLCCPDEKKIGQLVRAKAWQPEEAPPGIAITVTQEPTVRG